MHLVKDKSKAFLALIIFSLLTFVIWRVEVEYYGWEGLIWLEYDHKAIPISLLLFVLWVNVFFNLGNFRQKLAINVLLLFWIFVGAISFPTALQYHFIAGPSAMVLWAFPSILTYFFLVLTYLFLPLFPILTLFSLRLLKIKIPFKRIIIAQVLFLLSLPMAYFSLMILPDKGYIDAIHTIKNGYIFPFLFFALGLPLIYSYRYTKKSALVLDTLDSEQIKTTSNEQDLS